MTLPIVATIYIYVYSVYKVTIPIVGTKIFSLYILTIWSRDYIKSMYSDGVYYTCSRDCSRKDGGRNYPGGAGRPRGVSGPRGKPVQLWEIQRTLGRGDYIEVIVSLSLVILLIISLIFTVKSSLLILVQSPK